jgi:hypothetical protein
VSAEPRIGNVCKARRQRLRGWHSVLPSSDRDRLATDSNQAAIVRAVRPITSTAIRVLPKAGQDGQHLPKGYSRRNYEASNPMRKLTKASQRRGVADFGLDSLGALHFIEQR